ncbi:sugar ABC transporter ATP-binding protein [Frankia sp. AgW1.1]|uniref:sugar ABC transporter ATP-binding protein n=2 Tax=Frankia TaxID=1854 RepID=UPI001EE3DDE9|nr:sugar ABC transporter ATP-binding protein [Frankia sp. AgW1.1]
MTPRMVGHAPGAGVATRPAPQPRVLLRVSHLSKTFVGTKALDDLSLQVGAGEILAVVGQNGSGKSTLVKLLAGVHQPDPGATIEVGDGSGRLVPARDGRGLHFIHQDLGLLPMLSTTENLDLGRPLGSRWITPARRGEHVRAQRLTARFGADIDVRAPVALLSPAERAIVAIARAMDGWQHPENVLVLDEPTTAFHRDEVARLFEAVRRVAAAGAGIIFISHRLDEVRALADRVVVLRDGRLVAEAAAGQLDDDSLVRAIVGTAVTDARPAASGSEAVVLEVDDLRGARVDGVSLRLRAGEVVGVSGVLGSGRENVNALLFGSVRRRGGRVSLGGTELAPGDLTSAIERGAAFVPADRHRLGAVMTMSMRENLTLPALRRLRGRLGALRLTAERAEARRWVDEVELRPPLADRPLSTFSGGNQQKVVLAKWLRTSPRLLLLDEPTQGVDIGAKAAIYRLIQRAAAQGTAVLVSSADAKELVSICDRVLLVERGRIVGELTGAALTETALVHAVARADSAHQSPDELRPEVAT